MTNSQSRPRILLITRNLPPLVGGMERLNWHMAAELAKVAEVHIIGPEDSATLAPAGVVVREVRLKPLWKFLWRARALARREARGWKPDVVLAGSGLTAPLARAAARACGAKTAVYVHGLDVAVKHPVYRTVWLPAIRRSDRVIANSHATAELCHGIGVDPARIGIVHPGVDMPQDLARPMVGACVQATADNPPSATTTVAPTGTRRHVEWADFRTRHDLGNRPLLLSVGRLSARKGLREFVTQALPRIAAARPDVVLLVVGDAPRDALNAAVQTQDSIHIAAVQSGVANNLRFLGTISDDELEAAYRTSDVHVFPVREIPGDPEGFGMVAIEAAAHGLPTVAFATGGIPDAVVEGKTGSLIQAGDYTSFAACVNAWLARDDRAAIGASCVAAAECFSWEHFGEAMRDFLVLFR